VILWRRSDLAAFEVAVFRSYAASFWHWLTTAAEAEGLQLARSV
jgi:sarcosine oxidase gamma subunit